MGERMDDVQSVTSARKPRSEDLAHRQRQYLIAMGIRVVCFLLLVVTPLGWLTWVWGLGAVVLPYVAVLLANAGGHGVHDGPTRPARRPAPSLPVGGTVVRVDVVQPTSDRASRG